jgi:hypothetical protein
MTGRIRVRVLMQREGPKGEVVNLFPSRRTGIIHREDGYDVTFSDDSLVVGFSYLIQEDGLGTGAVEVRHHPGEPARGKGV